MTVRFGVLGAGRIGKVHAKAVSANPDAKLVAVADAMADAANALAAQYGAEVRSISQIEAANDIDAVVICTPTDTHDTYPGIEEWQALPCGRYSRRNHHTHFRISNHRERDRF